MNVAEAVQKGYLDSDMVEELAKTSIPERPEMEINFDKGTILDKVTMTTMTIDEAEQTRYIDEPTAKALHMMCGEWKDMSKTSSGQDSMLIKKLITNKTAIDDQMNSKTTKSVPGGILQVEGTPKKKKKQVTFSTLNEYIRMDDFDSEVFVEAVRYGDIHTDDSYIVNPRNTDVINLTRAIDESVFDMNTAHIVNTQTHQRWTLKEAYNEGLIPPPGQTITRTMQTGFVTNNFQYLDDSDKHIHTAIETNLKTSLKEPMVKPKGMTFIQGVEQGYIDEQSGTFHNPYNGDIMSIAAAIEYGWISESGESVIVEPERKYEKTVIVNQVAPTDELRRISFTQALDQGFIDLAKGQYTEPSTGDRMTILDAIRNQLIDTTLSEEERSYTENMTLSAAIDNGCFDEETGLFINKTTGEKMTLLDAVDRGYVDGSSKLYDVKSGKMYTLKEAMSKGKIDAVTGQYVESSSSKMSFKSAAKAGVIALIGAPYMAIKAATGRGKNSDALDMSTLTRKSKTSSTNADTKSTDSEPITIEATKFSVLGPTTLEVTQVKELTSVTAKDSEKMNFMEAVSSGYMTLETGMYQNPDTGVYMNLKKAVDEGHIHPDSVKIKLASGQCVNLKDAMDQHIIDNTGHLVEDGGQTSLDDMLKDGKLQETIPGVHAAASLVMKTTDKVQVNSVVDPRNNALCTLSQALDTGLINPHDGTYTNPKTGDVMTIMDAVKFGFIQGQVIDSITMKEGLSKEGFKAEVTFSEKKQMKVAAVLDTATGDKISLHEAIRKGIIDELEGQYKNARTGERMGLLEAMDHNYVTASEVEANMSTSDSYTKTAENVFSETKSLDIDTIIDPHSHKSMTIPEAVERGVLNVEAGLIRNIHTGQEMTISEGIRQGFVKGSQTNRKSGIFTDTLPKQYVHHKQAVHIKSVYDKDQGRFVSVRQAIQKGILDENLGLYVNDDGTTMPISRAVNEGLIEADREDASSLQDADSAIQETVSFTIHSVLDPLSGRRVGASEAIRLGLLDLTNGIYHNTKNNERMTIPEAVSRRYIEADTITPSSTQLSVLKPVNVQLEMGKKAFTVKAVVDSRTNEKMSVTEAVSSGILDKSMCKYLDKRTGQQLSLRDAAEKGLVVVDEVKGTPVSTLTKHAITVKTIVDPLTGKEYGLKKAIEKGLFDPDRGLVHNKLTDQMIPLDDAVRQGLASVDHGPGITEEEIVRGIVVQKVKDPMTGKELDVTEAKRRGILDSDSGHYVDFKTHTKMTVEDALDMELIVGRKNKPYEKQSFDKKDSREITLTQVLDTRTGVEVNIQEAVHRGLLDKSLSSYTDLRTGKSYDIEDAMKEGLVSGTVAVGRTSVSRQTSPTTTTTYNIISVMDTATGKQLSVSEALKSGILAPSGMFVDTRTGKIIPVSDAIKQGLVETEVKDKSKKQQKFDKFYKIDAPGTEQQVVTFTQGLKNKFINSMDGNFTNPFDGSVSSVDEAIITEVLVSDEGKPFHYKPPRKDRVSYSFKQAFLSGLIDADTGLYWDVKKGKSYGVEEALSKSYLTPLANPSLTSGGSVSIVKGGFAKPFTTTDIGIQHEPAAVEFKTPKDHSAQNGAEVVAEETDSTSPGSNTSSMQKQDSIQFMSMGSSPDTTEHSTSETEESYSLVPITLTEALTAGLIDTQTGEYIDPKTFEGVSVDEAVICGFLDLDQPEVLEENLPLNVEKSLSITEAIKSGLIDTGKAVFTTPSGETFSLQKAIQLGYIQPKLTQTEDKEDDKSEKPTQLKPDEVVEIKFTSPFSPRAGELYKDGKLVSKTATEVVVSEGSVTYATRPGFFMDSTGKVVNSITGERMNLKEAMQCGIVDIEDADGKSDVKIIGTTQLPPTLGDDETDSAVRIDMLVVY